MSAFFVVSTCLSSTSDPFHYHTHPQAEIIYIKSGKIVFDVAGREYQAGAGDVLVIGRLERHGTHILKEPYTRYCINISYDIAQDRDASHRLLSVLQGNLQDREHVLHTAGRTAVIEDLMFRIITECNEKKPMADELASACVNQLLIELYRLLPQDLPQNRNSLNQQMLLIQQHIDNHFTDSLSVEQLAHDNFISPDYLAHAFKQTTGYSPKQYIGLSRLLHARRLLVESELPIGAVAHHSGFADVNNFIRSFKKYFGESPGQYRQNLRASQ